MTSSLGEGTIRIFDLNGRKVFDQNATLEGGLNINASELSRGVYLLQIATGTISETTKLIIR